MANTGTLTMDFAKRIEVLNKLLKQKGISVWQPMIQPRKIKQAPLSFAQQWIWVIDQLLGDARSIYNVYFALRITGSLDVKAVENSLAEVVRRHEALRMRFLTNEAGVPVQELIEDFELNVTVSDLRELPREQREEEMKKRLYEAIKHRFNLGEGNVLLRSELMQLEDGEHVAVLVMHHIVSDAWSTGILIQEFAELYKAEVLGTDPKLKPLRIQYADYATWQREWLRDDELERQLGYWRQKLAGAPEILDLPGDHPRPFQASHRGATYTMFLGQELAARVKELARSENATLFIVLLAAFKVLLYRWTGQNDLVVGTPVGNRNREEIEHLIGFFVNTLALRTELQADNSFQDVVRAVRQVLLEAQAHQDLPFQRLVEELQPKRNLSVSPVFQVLFGVQTTPRTNATLLELPDLMIREVEVVPDSAKFDFELSLAELPEGLVASFGYSTDLFEAKTVRRMAEHYRILLEAVVAAPRQGVLDIPLISPEETKQLLEKWALGANYELASQSLVEMLETACQTHEASVAVRHGEDSLTYKALHQRSNQLARYLQRRGVRPESRVGLFLERSPEVIVSLLAILRAGAVYVPLDPGYPPKRLEFMAADASLELLLTDSKLSERVTGFSGVEVVSLDIDRELIEAEDPQPVLPITLPESLAYLIYTSGSTGQPKAVMIDHEGLTNHLWAKIIDLHLTQSDVVGQTASLSFDISVWQILVPLLLGGPVEIIEDEVAHDGAAILRESDRRGVTILETVPSLLRIMLEGETRDPRRPFVTLRAVICQAAPLGTDMCRQWIANCPKVALINAYGATEASDDVTHYHLDIGQEGQAELRDLIFAPLGRPLINSEIYILDEQMGPVPVGVSGEVYLGGRGVGRGYWKQPALTASKFIPNPFSKTKQGDRLYRTGDLARFRDNGNIEFLERRDYQVKIRGLRVDLGEIEAAVREYPGVRDAVVIVREDSSAIPVLTAYILPADGKIEISTQSIESDLREHVRAILPEHMVPARYMVLPAFPLSPNGKIDRKALPVPEGIPVASLSQEYLAPRNAIEEVLTAIWSTVLGMERVGIQDNFFELGGHSLSATQVMSRVRSAFGCSISLRMLFESPTIEQLGKRIEETLRSGGETHAAPPIGRRRARVPLSLSFAQERLWFLNQFEPDTATYNIAAAARLEGNLDIPALQRSLNAIANRHESLRTRFCQGMDGRPVQEVRSDVEIHLPVFDVSETSAEDRELEIEQRIHQQAVQPFNLALAPLLRAELLKVGHNEHIVVLAMHHIVSDGWSMRILLRELQHFYLQETEAGVAPLEQLPMQYADYAQWQREAFSGDALEKELRYWRKQLGDAPASLELPTDYARPAMVGHAGATQTLRLGQELAAKLKQLSRAENATLFMTLIAAFKVLLSRWTGQDDIVVGTPAANRSCEEMEELIGLFVNTLALRTYISPDQTFLATLNQVRETTLQAFLHQDLPFDKLVDTLHTDRDTSRSPVFQVMFVLQDAARETIELGKLKLAPVHVETKTAKFDLTLVVDEEDGELVTGVEYRTDLFRSGTIARFMTHYRRLLETVVARPGHKLQDLPLLTDAEVEQLEEWNRTDYEFEGSEQTLIQLLAEAARKHASRPAVSFEGHQWTYEELGQRSNDLARYLRSCGVGPEVRVGVCLERSAELVLALVSVIKAGGAYVPLDPDYPRERLEFMLGNADVRLVLSMAQFLDRLPDSHQAEAILLDDDSYRALGEIDLDPQLDLDNLAYVIYTSGSTGNPKGAMISHRAIVNRLLWMQSHYHLGPDDHVLQKTPFTFDVSVWEFFWTLMTGATLVVARPGGHQEPRYLCELISKERVTVLHFVPSMLQAFLEDEVAGSLDSLRHVICSGEALPPALKNKCVQQIPAQLHNLYGPTETAVDVTAWRCMPEDTNVPIGKPIANIQTYILDSQLSPVPVGVHGELYIAGIGVGRGYVGRGDLTADRFVPNPFGEPGSRMYKTGDSVRYLPNGSIEFLGRKDDQVKIRGFRIELAEIAGCMQAHLDVADATAVVREDRVGERRLVGYVVPRHADNTTIATELRAFLKTKLPDYMVPWSFVVLDSLPLTSSGKLNRRALPAPQVSRTTELVAPRNPVEATLAGVWREVLGVADLSMHDNFFELGGDSIRSIQIVSLAKKRGLDISLQQLFRYQTIGELARIPNVNAAVSALPRTMPFELCPAIDLGTLPDGIEDAYPLTRMQAAMLYHAQLTPDSPMYHNVDSVYLETTFDFDALQEAMQAVVDRHPNLRTSFHLNGYSEPLQLVHARATANLGLTDLSDLPEDEQEQRVREFMRSEQQPSRFFDITCPPLLRLYVHKRGANRFQLTFTENHAIQDGWSLHSTFGEIFDNYFHLVEHGALPSRPPVTSSYRDFVNLERLALEDPAHRRYWEEKLDGHRAIRLARHPLQDSTGLHDTYWVDIPSEVSAGLKELARRAAVPVKSVLLATHMKVLSLLSGDTDVLSGISTNGRLEEGDSTEARGLFLNTAPFRMRLESSTWEELAKAAFAEEWRMLPYRRYPLAEIQKNWGSEGMVDINFLFTHFHVVDSLLRSPEIRVLDFKSSNPTSLALVPHFFLNWTTADVRLNLVYDPERFTRDQIARIGGYYYRGLEAMATQPVNRHDAVELLSAAERHQVAVQWNESNQPHAQYQCVHQMLEEQVDARPRQHAVVFQDKAITYRTLERRANQLAHYLKNQGVGPEVRVGICLERSVDMVVAVLGILKAGGAYVPLNPDHPQDRLSFVIEDAQLPLIVTNERLRGRLPASLAQEICLDLVERELAEESEERIGNVAAPENLAYVIYTSGSTGRPKGVMIPHCGLVNYLGWCRNEYRIGEGAGAVVHSPLEFDLTVTSLLGPLVSGKPVVLVSEEEGVEGLGRALSNWRELSLIKLTPAHLDVLEHTVGEQNASGRVHAMIIGGETLTPNRLEFWRAHSPNTRLINEYGPTETVVGCCTYEVRMADVLGDSVPIGRPIVNTKLYILGSGMDLVPAGMTGEIYIGGSGVGRGYLNRADLTAERYLPNPYSNQPGARLYRTGDLGRYLEDGNIECLGRIDHQVKIRGYRIELGEIENVLKRHGAVSEVVALVREEGPEKQLAAVIVPVEGMSVSDQELREYGRQHLPEYMVPSLYVYVNQLPLTTNGKVDRKAIAGYRFSASSRALEPPRYGAEARMLQIWKDVLGVSEISITDDFFELGGHSLAALRVIAQIQDRFGVELPLSQFWEALTVKSMTSAVMEAIANAPQPDKHFVALRTTGTNPPLFFAHPAGGNVFGFSHLAHHLGSNQPFYALQSIDVQDPDFTIEQLAAEYLAEVEELWPDGPYLLGGWSFGGGIAFEMARQLQMKGKGVALLAIVDREAPRGPEEDIDPVDLARNIEAVYRLRNPLNIDETYLVSLGEAEQLNYIIERGREVGVMPENIDNERAIGMLKNLKARINANRRYAPKPYGGLITLFWHYLESDAPEEDVTQGWNALSSLPVEVHSVPGSHVSILEEPYVRALAESLAECIAKACSGKNQMLAN